MYLGYGERKNTIINDPISSFNVNEILIGLDLSFVGKRNIYIDSLLGYPNYQNCTTEHVVSEDLTNVFSEPEDSSRSLIKSFQEDGYAQHVVRLLCADNTILYVLSKVFLHINQENVPVMISYSVPFAFSSQTQRTIDEGMRMITTHEQWLALVPSFFTPPDKPLCLEDICPTIEASSPDLQMDSSAQLMSFPHRDKSQILQTSEPCTIEELMPDQAPPLDLVDVLDFL